MPSIYDRMSPTQLWESIEFHQRAARAKIAAIAAESQTRIAGTDACAEWERESIHQQSKAHIEAIESAGGMKDSCIEDESDRERDARLLAIDGESVAAIEAIKQKALMTRDCIEDKSDAEQNARVEAIKAESMLRMELMQEEYKFKMEFMARESVARLEALRNGTIRI
jgi:hypothetical protein